MIARYKPIVVCFLFLLPYLPLKGQEVGLLMGTFVSDRWYIDQKLFSERIEQLGGRTTIDLAYTHEDQLSRARKMIGDGIDVVVLVPIDGEKAREIAELCKSAGVPLISYDRLVLSNDISAFLTYNSERVGKLQAQYAVKRVPAGKYLLLSGPATDYNSVLLRSGQMSVLQPLIDRGDIQLINDIEFDNWSEISSYELSAEYFAEGNPVPDVVLAGNDALAHGFIQAMPRDSIGKVIISGQDADLAAIRNILEGRQTMTVYKPIAPLANAAAEMAMKFARGQHVDIKGVFVKDDIRVPAVLFEPKVVDVSNYKETVARDGHMAMAEAFRSVGRVFENERNRIQLALMQKEIALDQQKQQNQRNTLLAIIAFFFASVIGLAYTIHQKQNDNKLLNEQKSVIENKNRALTSVNDQLYQLNEKLVMQKEEIAAQRDAIADQNQRLAEVNEIIGKQRDEIQHQNEKLEEEVRKRTAELILYIRQLEQYSFVTAHNLRAPVARIIGLCQLVKMEKVHGGDTEGIIEKLIVASQELDLVFRELNAILDIRTFSMEIFSPVNLGEEVKNILANLKYEIDQANAIIETDFSQVPVITSIKPYMNSILFNLISNAIKYRHLERRPVIKITSSKCQGRILITVADNGLGISQDYLDKIFQLYKRFHFHVEGRGIGLFLVKTQMDSLGGNVDIESEVGRGTVVRLWLDIA